jgi:hypothetical protein
MRRLDYAAAAVMLLLAGVIVFATQDLTFWDEFGPSTRFMPLWVAGVSALLAVLLILEAARRSPDAPVDWPDRRGARRVALTFAAICGFIAIVPWLGFVLATAVFVLVMLFGVERRPVLPALFTAAITALLIQAVFIWWLSIALPKGALGI